MPPLVEVRALWGEHRTMKVKCLLTGQTPRDPVSRRAVARPHPNQQTVAWASAESPLCFATHATEPK